VFPIPLYGFGYWGVARGIMRRTGARRAYIRDGALGGAYGGVVHGITGMAGQLERASGVAPGDPLAFVARLGAFLVPLWIGLAVAIAAGSLVFAVAVARGPSAFPRWMAFANPLALVLLAALLGAPTPIGRALLVPAAPNLAHVWFFALAGIALGGRSSQRA
jgi:hypothetical protein